MEMVMLQPNIQVFKFGKEGIPLHHVVFAILKPLTSAIYKSLSDDELMNKVGKGDDEAFNELFDRHIALVVGYGTRFLNQKEKAEEIAQEVWVQVVKRAVDYQPESHFRAWILTMTRNACLTEIRDNKEMLSLNSEEEIGRDHNLIELITPEDILSLNEDTQQLKLALNNLPTQQRAVLMIRLTEDLSYEEIARILDLTESSVKSILFRAKKNIEMVLRGGLK